MKFKSEWITTLEFINQNPINVFHKEEDRRERQKSVLKNYHIHFRKKFVQQDTEKIYMNTSADDYYKLYVNGMFVCQGPAPSYPDCYNYNRVELSPYLTSGENVVAVHVYYQGLINRTWVSGDNRQGMIADVFKGGSFLFGTDESWLYAKAEEFSGETIGYDTAFLENIDFNRKEREWKDIGFDDSHYKHALIKQDADYCFAEEPVRTIEVYKKMPEKVIEIEPGKFFIDFGEEITGQFCMSVKGIQGQKVRILCGEETEEDNSLLVRANMRCTCNYDETCILSGGTDTFEFYDYKAFRYVNVFFGAGSEDSDQARSFCAIVRHHAFEEKLTLKTEIPYLKDIWDICRNGVKYGAQEALLDCPSREKGLYLGDYTVSGLAHLYMTGDAGYYRKTLFDFAATAKVCKGLMAVANCSQMQEIADFSLQYPLQVLNYYKVTKDRETVRRLYPVVCDILEYFKQFERTDGLLEDVWEKWNLVDWPANLRDDYDAYITPHKKGLDCHNVLNAFYIGTHQAADEIREILGYKKEADIENLKNAFIKAFYNGETGLFCDSEKLTHSSLHANALTLYFGIAAEDMHNRIRDFIMNKGLCCGVQFSYFVLKGLGRIGAYEEELSLLVNESEHSWVNMLREGATTCFEAWGKEQKWNTSLCHPWASAPIIILVEDLNHKFGIEIL